MLNELYVDTSMSVSVYDWLCRVGWDFNFAFRAYGDLWREHRRDFHRFFNPVVVSQHRPQIIREVKHALVSLLNTPQDFMEHFRQYVSTFYYDPIDLRKRLRQASQVLSFFPLRMVSGQSPSMIHISPMPV